MKQYILDKATDLFLSDGFKTVTMDFLSESMTISKKTLYKHFKNKAELIEASITNIHSRLGRIMEENHRADLNAVVESFYIKDKMPILFKSKDHQSIYELQKYYPEIHKRHEEEAFDLIHNHFKYIITKGQASGHFHADVNIEQVSRFYNAYVLQMYMQETYEKYLEVERCILQYHFRGISTQKGLEELNKQLIEYDKH